MSYRFACSIGRKTFALVGLFFLLTPFYKLHAEEPNDSISDVMPETIPAEIIADWEDQDKVDSTKYDSIINKIASSLPSQYASKIQKVNSREAYLKACHWRRVYRIKYYYSKELKRILFAKHYDLGGPYPEYIADLNPDDFKSGIGLFGDSVAISKGINYQKGSALCLLEFTDCYSKHKEIISDPEGVIRDPCASFDGKKVVFAWSKNNNGYHLYEVSLDSTDKIRQLTDNPEGLIVSDFEPCYLQDSNIIFNSTRCFGFNSAYLNPTTNLYIINKDGKYLRRVTYDQFSNFSPSLRKNGTLLYSRWEANDRDVYACFPVMTMNIDGCQQTELFGNQSVWPQLIFQAREIPNAPEKILAIISSFGCGYAGELAIININIARNGSKAIKLVAPQRNRPSDTTKFINGTKALFQNPYPLDEEWFLISWRPTDEKKEKNFFRIYLMNIYGERELLAWDTTQSLSQPISLCPSDPPPKTKYQTDYNKTESDVLVYNVYEGMAMDKSLIPEEKNIIKKIRVVALEYRTDPVFGHTGSTEYCFTPVARWLGTREAKRIIGEIEVEKDGSAAFKVPARVPLYFQLIDSNGCVAQSMRSWVTFQPHERYQCFGCHENKNESHPQGKVALALNPKPLNPFYGIKNDYLYYPTHIQPIFDQKCISCHNETHPKGLNLKGDKIWTGDLDDPDNKYAERFWCRSYYNLTDTAKKYVNFISAKTSPEQQKPYSYGSSKSLLIEKLRKGHNNVSLTTEEIEKLCAWIDLGIPHSGSYTDDMKPEHAAKYVERLSRRKKHEELEAANVKAFEENGGYPIPGVIIPYKKGILSNKLSLLRFFISNKTLSIKPTSEGTITVLDLRGRKVASVKITTETLLKKSSVLIPLPVGKGIYILTFTGKNGEYGRSLFSVM
ncbi:MAG: hypothetical protein N2053_03950 [Chitinispirillaceae bacterium]|nr:hypothetical protein [Chitinispirillaceae bacterium]